MDQWMFSVDDLSKTPSVQDGFSPGDEAAQKAWACIYIRRIGRDLKLSTETVATAKYFLQRFYLRKSLRDVNPYEVAPAALYLSCKLSDSYRKLRIFIISTVKIIAKQTITESSKEYRRWSNAIQSTEEMLAEALCFDFSVALPHYYALKLIDDIGGSESLKRLTLELCDDASCTSIILYQPPITVAAIALYVASLSMPGALIDRMTGASGVECLSSLDYPELQALDDITVADWSRELRFDLEGPVGLKDEQVTAAFKKLADFRAGLTVINGNASDVDQDSK
ncbi:hypothetical protein SmJEL517_g06040 [Synchytrium microbalum]|uniref:Cyclin-like domain-containing protein n=1 Tax=Synchytrium microbalum TaxID=1806994 RepID=A0A507BHS1_9FUNG|nr:uncharacterized protein SmJEL517_g06040 [Synchytrium microbalum]TPX30390.1 hypothetical protein SmJEL517_g06040 [Synchytrium microbalum]